MTVNPVQMLALIAEATDARPLQASSFQTDLDKICKLLFALPFLPPSDIRGAFEIIVRTTTLSI